MFSAKCTMVWLKKEGGLFYTKCSPRSFFCQPALLSAEPRKLCLNIQKYDYIYKYITCHVLPKLSALAFCIKAQLT
jgi:hypothetical protein